MTTLQYDPATGIRTVVSSNTSGLKDAATVTTLPADKGVPEIMWAARYRQRQWNFPEFRVFNNIGSLRQSNVWRQYGYGYRTTKQNPDERAEFYVWFGGQWHRLYAKDISRVTNKNVHVFLAKKQLEFAIQSGDFEQVAKAVRLLDTAL